MQLHNIYILTKAENDLFRDWNRSNDTRYTEKDIQELKKVSNNRVFIVDFKEFHQR